MMKRTFEPTSTTIVCSCWKAMPISTFSRPTPSRSCGARGRVGAWAACVRAWG
jgi:hypothetical protein